jgi:hypothetical protein
VRKRIFVSVLCVLLLAGSAVGAAGRAEDPLISLRYLTDTYLPEVRASFSEITARALDAQRSAYPAVPGRQALSLTAGDRLLLPAGSFLVMTAGAGRLTVKAGETVNATQGWLTSGGDVRIGNRYIVCENSEALLDVSADSCVIVSAGAATLATCPFLDVEPESWYYADVLRSVSRGLIDGMTPTSYAPLGTLTVAQCVKLAACMHQLRQTGAVTLAPGTPWYRPYADYALQNAILDAEASDYDAVINRRDFVRIFYRALPASSYAAINSIPDDSVPDVGMGDGCAGEIYAFYRAGILSGYTNTPGFSEHAFGPESSITRAEVAAIMNRMFDDTARVRFSIN